VRKRESAKMNMYKMRKLMRKISHFIHRLSESIFRTFALYAKSANSSTPIHKVQLPNRASVILLLFN